MWSRLRTSSHRHQYPNTPPTRRTVRFPYRNWSRVDTAALEDNLPRSILLSSSAAAADEFSNQLADVVTTDLNNLAHIRYFTRRKSNPIATWLSKEAIEAKRERRRLEKSWKSSKSGSDRAAYCRVCRSVNKLINMSRREYIRHEIDKLHRGQEPLVGHH